MVLFKDSSNIAGLFSTRQLKWGLFLLLHWLPVWHLCQQWAVIVVMVLRMSLAVWLVLNWWSVEDVNHRSNFLMLRGVPVAFCWTPTRQGNDDSFCSNWTVLNVRATSEIREISLGAPDKLEKSTDDGVGTPFGALDWFGPADAGAAFEIFFEIIYDYRYKQNPNAQLFLIWYKTACCRMIQYFNCLIFFGSEQGLDGLYED